MSFIDFDPDYKIKLVEKFALNSNKSELDQKIYECLLEQTKVNLN